MKETFGGFVKQKRIVKNISLRTFADVIGVSPEYLSKIENNLRTAPKDIVIEKIANKLSLCNEEKEILLDLAAKSKSNLSLASDLMIYINENEMVHKTLRIAKRKSLSNEEWQEIFNLISKK
ncbi:MAG: helix-turn-helix transcriptional regulator [Ruminococcus sp.]|nr:helix-turn-helix transcriptional regulator [Ruminococcus sp.]